MGNDVCPVCGKPDCWWIRMTNDETEDVKTLLFEIDRLKAALGKEMERGDIAQYHLNKACVERDEARKWAGRMLREATIAQQNHVLAIQREMISGSKLFDRETRLTTLAKELGRVQRERDAEVERAVEAEAEVERLLYAMDAIKYYLKTGDTELLQKIARERGDELWTKHSSKS